MSHVLATSFNCYFKQYETFWFSSASMKAPCLECSTLCDLLVRIVGDLLVTGMWVRLVLTPVLFTEEDPHFKTLNTARMVIKGKCHIGSVTPNPGKIISKVFCVSTAWMQTDGLKILHGGSLKHKSHLSV